ncbi:MAG TPA: replicative DNA helicase [Gammaproteobacteria bacterium]|jgi:replicative DNA helicase|nr:replicative DNA helicase [Gammaproteobacteria bacterium]
MPTAVKSLDQAAASALEAMRTPPHSLEAEQAVLGGLMLDNTAWERVADRVTEEDFYRQDHRLVFRAMAELADADQPFDAVTLSEWLQARGKLEQAGGLAYLATLARDTPTAANVRAYADIVRERSVLRQLIRVGGELAESAFRPEGRSVAELVDQAERSVFEIAERGDRMGKSYVRISELMSKAVDRLDTLVHADSHVTGVATGLSKFDEMTAGLQPGDLVIVAGRPSMGKTSFAMNIAEYAAISGGLPAAIFSMEMSGEQLAMRMISSLGRIDQLKVRTGKLDDTDWKRVSSAISIMSKAPMFIDDTGALTPTELRARARRLKRDHNLGLIVVDYLQLMQVPGTRENRATEISEICRGLKSLAKELRIPVIALSQLNRSLEQRPDKRPIMSDLRESGSIEQDADVIVFIYRDEVYDKDSPDKGTAEIIIGKQRNGPIGMVRSTFLGQFTRFENYTADDGGGYA